MERWSTGSLNQYQLNQPKEIQGTGLTDSLTLNI